MPVRGVVKRPNTIVDALCGVVKRPNAIASAVCGVVKRPDAKTGQIEILSNGVAIAANANRKLGDMSPLPKGYGQHHSVPYMTYRLTMQLQLLLYHRIWYSRSYKRNEQWL